MILILSTLISLDKIIPFSTISKIVTHTIQLIIGSTIDHLQLLIGNQNICIAR